MLNEFTTFVNSKLDAQNQVTRKMPGKFMLAERPLYAADESLGVLSLIVDELRLSRTSLNRPQVNFSP